MKEARFDQAVDRAAFIADYLNMTRAVCGGGEQYPVRWLALDLDGEKRLVMLEMREFDGRVRLDFIGVPDHEDRRRGLATRAVQILCDLADTHHVCLFLTVMPPKEKAARGPNKAKLSSWYRKFGFEQWQFRDCRRRYPKSGTRPEEYETSILEAAV